MVQERTDRQRRESKIAAILFLTVLSAYLARVSLSVALPFIATDFGWSAEQLGGLGGVLLGIFLVGYGLSNVFISPLADCYGPKKGLLISVAVWSALTLLTGVVGMYYAAFVLLRTSLGLAQGVVFPSAGKITQAWFPPEKRSRMNALYYGAIALANILSPLLLIPLILVTSWNIMFVVLAILGFALLVPILLWLRDSPEGPPKCEQKTLADNLRFTVDNLKAAARVKGLFVLTFGHALESIVFWGLSLWLPTFLVMARGFSRDELIWAAALPYLGYIAGLIIGSTLSDRTGKRSLVTGLFCLAGSAVFVLMIPLSGKVETIVALGAEFFFIALVGPNVATLLQGCCTSRLTCSATGIENGIANGLGALGPILVGLVVLMTGSYNAAFLLLAFLLILSGAVILRFKIYELESTCPLPGQQEKDYHN
jgi:MFS family permease